MGYVLSFHERIAPMRFIIAPMGTGKTTYAKKTGAYDDDDARDPSAEPELDRLRRIGAWDAHNRIWHGLLRKWVATLPASAVVMCHSFADASAMGATRENTLAIVPDRATQLARLAKRATVTDHIRSLSERNLHTVVNDVIEHRLEWRDDLPA